MPRKHDVDKINLQIDDLEFFNNGFKILWFSDISFGEYTIINENGKILGFSECMDSQDDKVFIKKLFELLTDKLIIKE
jgi:hypothetical protein